MSLTRTKLLNYLRSVKKKREDFKEKESDFNQKFQAELQTVSFMICMAIVKETSKQLKHN